MLRRTLLAVMVGGALAATAASARLDAFSDPTDDQHKSPDIVAVNVGNGQKQVVVVRVRLRQALAPRAWLVLHFDTRPDGRKGRGTDEAMALYRADGTVELSLRRAGKLVRVSKPLASARAAGGTVAVKVPRAALGGAMSFRLAVVARQEGEGPIRPIPVASDFTPQQGWLTVDEAQSITVGDPVADGDSAPDIRGVTVTTGSDGFVRFVVRFTGRVKPSSWIALKLDVDSERPSGDEGFDVYLMAFGTTEVFLGQYFKGEWRPAPQPWEVTATISRGVMRASIHRRSLLDPDRVPATRFRFWAEAVAVSERNESEFEFHRDLEGYDLVPDSDQHSYQLP